MSNGQSFFQLLTPLILLVFAAGFFTVFALQRALRSSLWFGTGYLSGAAAFLISFFRISLDPVLVTFSSNTAFLLCMTLVTNGVAVRYRKKMPWTWTASAFLAMYLGLAWFMFADNDISARSIVVNFSAAAIFALAAALVGRRRAHLIDRIIFWMIAAISAQFVLRPLLVFGLANETLTYENYAASVFALTLEFTSSVCALAFAVVLFIAQGMDIVTELARKSETDHLSGLMNKGGFELKSESFLRAQERAAIPVSLVVCDIDHFKSVNDRHGHPAGDRVIAELGRILAAGTRAADVCGRIGGEEFCVLLWSTNLAGARIAAEGLRLAIEQFAFSGPMSGQSVTASFGVAERGPGESFQSLFRRTDAALYEAKQNGRNRVKSAVLPATIAKSPLATQAIPSIQALA